jgi:glycosyltransferase involved in cell wall biosynthesis
MRITFILPLVALEGGVRVVAEHARRLSERGHEVSVISLGRPKPLPLERRLKNRVKALLRGDLSRSFLPEPAFVPPASHFDAIGHLHRRVGHHGPIVPDEAPDADVIVATWWETADWVAAFPASKGRKVHLIQHDERVTGRTEADRHRIGQAVWTHPGFTRVAVSEWIARVGREEFGVECGVVPNAVDSAVFDGSQRERSEPPAVGFMDSSVPFKGADVSQKAYELARVRRPDLRLICFGFEPDPDRPLPADAQYYRAPPQATIAEVYRSCDAWLFASRCEGYGLPLLESAACGTPVIATPTGAAPELFADGRAGRLVPFDDAPAMADAILELLSLPQDAWRSMSDHARTLAARHTWDRATDAFERVLLHRGNA